jgi:putative FmdB family regulatory protein
MLYSSIVFYSNQEMNSTMPLYEYHCTTCGDDFEKMVRFNETVTSPECPHCHSLETHKLISRVAAYGTGLSSAASASSGSNCKTSGPFR